MLLQRHIAGTILTDLISKIVRHAPSSGDKNIQILSVYKYVFLHSLAVMQTRTRLINTRHHTACCEIPLEQKANRRPFFKKGLEIM